MSEPTQLEPADLSMEALLAEDGQCVTAGHPDGPPPSLEEVVADARRRWELARAKHARAKQLLAAIADHEAKIAELQKELEATVREYVEARTGAPAP